LQAAHRVADVARARLDEQVNVGRHQAVAAADEIFRIADIADDGEVRSAVLAVVEDPLAADPARRQVVDTRFERVAWHPRHTPTLPPATTAAIGLHRTRRRFVAVRNSGACPGTGTGVWRAPLQAGVTHFARADRDAE